MQFLSQYAAYGAVWKLMSACSMTVWWRESLRVSSGFILYGYIIKHWHIHCVKIFSSLFPNPSPILLPSSIISFCMPSSPAYSQFFDTSPSTLSRSPFSLSASASSFFFFFFLKRLLTTHGNCSHASHLCLFLPPVHALCSGLFLCLSTCICLSVSTFCTQPFLAFRPWQPPSPLGVCSSGYIIYIRERCREEW